MPQQQDTYVLFLDDSGSSCPDRLEAERKDRLDAFALGGLLIAEQDIEFVWQKHRAFMIEHGLESEDGKLKHHLHSTKLRCAKNPYSWLRTDTIRAEAFYNGLNNLILESPILAHACVIHRPTYRERYGHLGGDKWQLCRSAYQILLERAVKYVRSVGGRKLLVYVEKTGRTEDARIQAYHSNLLEQGMEFDEGRSALYSPMPKEELERFLPKKVKFQTKESRLMQLADVVLYPLVKGGYDKTYPPYRFLIEHKKVIDSSVEDVRSMGVKYYCF